MLILMALAVPQILKVKKNANQTSAIQTIRTIGSAEISYSTSANGYACSLATLNLDPDLAASGQKSGYTFTVTCGSKTTINSQDVYNSVEIFGVPQTIGKTGDNGYCSDESGVIKIDPTGGTNCTEPLQ
jgi:type IV pilus assembly protein PilA